MEDHSSRTITSFGNHRWIVTAKVQTDTFRFENMEVPASSTGSPVAGNRSGGLKPASGDAEWMSVMVDDASRSSRRRS